MQYVKMFNDSHAIQCDQYLLVCVCVCVCFVSCSPSGQNLWTLSFVSQHGYRTLWPASNFTQGWQPVRMTPLTESPLTILYIHEQMIFMDSAGPSLFYKLMAMIFPFACWLILVIIWLQQMYLYGAFMFLDHREFVQFCGTFFLPVTWCMICRCKERLVYSSKDATCFEKSASSALITEQPVCLGTKSKHDCYTVPVYNGSLDGNSAVYGIGPKVSLPKRRILKHKWTCSRHAIA